ncbi:MULTISPECIES: helix-hairpin-helix domain-containing protein [Fusobacterium]|jgi:competence protein ComEA|uniref:Helix-hairpin-helix domain-containing protein n=1 Tax=Fusobacterium hominis TaxID=2764326 RepID=A0A7G9GX63_9FUSO|nr:MULTISPECIES: helix-hairpin-helix domain-containing protein [Fusobacterium]QNM15395.1 helix-hairpin-helix domain-containing protein [Fusobacterium hominis]
MRLKKSILIVMVMAILSVLTYGAQLEKSNENYDLIISTNVLKEETRYVDINTATLEELSNSGITMRQAKLIMDYRDKTGGFQNLQELKRIKGIGQATYDKMKLVLMIKEPAQRKPLYINEATDEDMKLYGLDKKYIKKIRKHINRYGRVENNMELIKLLPNSTYEKYKTIIKYDK